LGVLKGWLPLPTVNAGTVRPPVGASLGGVLRERDAATGGDRHPRLQQEV